MAQEAATPILRWAGSKRALLPRLRAIAPPSFSCYVEPFGGSLSLFFSLRPSEAILGDLNSDLIKCYRAVRENPGKVHASLRVKPKTRSHFNTLRATDPAMLNRFQRAARFIYLNKLCFNGLYRTNQAGQFNVPFSGVRSGSMPSLAQLRMFGAALRRTTLVDGDFEATLSHATLKDAFIYLDPPYAVERRRIFREYDRDSFALQDLDRFCDSLLQLDRAGARFLVSYSAHESVRHRFDRWNVVGVRVSRNIGGFADRRRLAREVLVSNYDVRSL
jgi:DNA adenine methylase